MTVECLTYLEPERLMGWVGRGGRFVGGVRGGGEWECKEVNCTRHTHTHTRMDDGICRGQGEGDRRETSTKIKMTINNKH